MLMSCFTHIVSLVTSFYTYCSPINVMGMFVSSAAVFMGFLKPSQSVVTWEMSARCF